MAKRRPPQRPEANVLYDNPASVGRVLSRLESLDALMIEAGSLERFEPLVSEKLDDTIAEMVAVAARYEAADVIEALRRNEMPTSLDGYRETESAGLLVVVELVALLSSPTHDRAPGSGPRLTPEDLEVLIRQGHRAIRLITFLRLAWKERAVPHPLLELSYALAEQALIVRSMHYEHIRKKYFDQLFTTPTVVESFRNILGFTWEEFDAVSTATVQLLEDRLNGALHAIGEAGGFDDEIEGDGLLDLMLKPGTYAAFTREELIGRVELDDNVVASVLSFLSLKLGELDAKSATSKLASGKNPFDGKSLALLPGERYVVVDPAQALDGFRASVEQALKSDAKAWKAYERNRASFAETETARLLSKLIGVSPRHSNLKYRGPAGVEGIHEYSSDHAIGPETTRLYEVDHLFVVENVAIAIEVKAGGLTPPARAGYADRLANDLGKTLGEAATQARRLRDLVSANGGLWNERGQWIDLSDVDIIHTVVVSLGDFGDAAIAMSDLAAAGLMPSGDYPWIVSLHDLAVIADLFEEAALFLLYLRRRTSPEIATLFSTSDELDLVMLFLKGGLYAFPSPDLLRAQDPTGRPPSGREVKDFERQTRSFVQSHTDDLDAWVHFESGSATVAAPRPFFRANERVQELVHWLSDGHKPGWFGFGADLLDGSSETQRGLERFLDGIVERSRSDGKSHSFAHGMNGQWGYVLLIAMTRGDDESQPEALDQLERYATLKKYQTRAARALTLLLGPGEDGPVYEAVGFAGGRWEYDERMEQLSNEMLQPLRDGRPPSAKRSTKRLR